MKEIKITESEIKEALAQIDALENLSTKDQGCLRLLTEEMFSMVKELLKKESLDFTVGLDNGKYTLCVATKTWVDDQAQKQFLSMSSSGKNAANKGAKGLLGLVLETLMYGATPVAYHTIIPYGMQTSYGDYSGLWTLSNYMEFAPPTTVRSDWDGMEKSIIANFADDVAIGVRSGNLEITVTKTL